MKFQKQITVHRPISAVLELLDNPEHPYRWQHDLTAITPMTGRPGSVGATAMFAYSSNGRKFQFKETVVSRNLHGETVATYEAPGLCHTIHTRMDAIDAVSTRLTFDNDLRFTGLQQIAGIFLGGTIRKQSEQNIDNLAAYLDAGASEPNGNG